VEVGSHQASFDQDSNTFKKLIVFEIVAITYIEMKPVLQATQSAYWPRTIEQRIEQQQLVIG